MMILWRISNHVDLSGRGGLLASGRWHHRGVPVVYCCDHPSTALLEILVHVDIEDVPETFQLLKISAPDDIPAMRIDAGATDLADKEWTRSQGSRMLDSADACLLQVPSVVMPEANNILINPRHKDAARLSILSATRYPFDSRLLS